MSEATEVSPRAASSGTAISWLANIFSFRAVLLGLLLTFPVFISSDLSGKAPGYLRDPDLWWHMQNAELLLSTHHFMRTDVYSFTTGGEPWMNFEWLSEIPYYLAYHALGERGVLFLTLACVEAILLCVFWLCWRQTENFKSACMAAVGTVLLATVNLGPRTILFGWLCLVAELLVLQSFSRGKHLYLWLLPPLFCLWINLHGSWLVGFVFFFLYIASGVVQGEWGLIRAERWTKAEMRSLGTVGLVSVAALFVNPYGWRLVTFPASTMLTQSLAANNGAEWQSINFHLPLGKVLLALLVTLVLLTLQNRRKWPLHELLFALFAVYAAFTYVRFTFLAGIILAPSIASEIAAFSATKTQQEKTRPMLNAVFLTVIAALALNRLPSAAALRNGIRAGFPPEAFERLGNLPPQSRVLNEYGYGGFMIWTDHATPVFVDPRAYIFEQHGVLLDYLHFINLTDTFGVLDKYKIDYVFFPKMEPVVYLLAHSSGWKVAYDDGVAVILERSHPGLAHAPSATL